IDFSDGKTQYLATKKCISGSGCNFQRFCHRAIFVGIDYEFNDFIQAVHRIYRFMQTKEVIIDIIYMDTEDEIIKELFAKWDRYNYQTQKMVETLKKFGLSNNEIEESLVRTMGVSRTEVKGTHFTAINNDCVEEMKTMEENSVDLIVTSIPFSNHYEYTPSYNDFGHNENNEKFF
ncbi:MAG: DNA methylase N-4, partial [Ruminococcus sp.]